MTIQFRLFEILVLLFALNAGLSQATALAVAPGLWQITIVDFADRINVTKECIKTSDWSGWIVFAGSSSRDDSCEPPVTTFVDNVVNLTQACKSVSAEMTISVASAERLSGNVITSSVTPYGMAIPFHSKFEAQRLSADCP